LGGGQEYLLRGQQIRKSLNSGHVVNAIQNLNKKISQLSKNQQALESQLTSVYSMVQWTKYTIAVQFGVQ
jgi:flagellar biosynthesis chaperone FliJ